jgi:hypothetical protein
VLAVAGHVPELVQYDALEVDLVEPRVARARRPMLTGPQREVAFDDPAGAHVVGFQPEHARRHVRGETGHAVAVPDARDPLGPAARTQAPARCRRACDPLEASRVHLQPGRREREARGAAAAEARVELAAPAIDGGQRDFEGLHGPDRVAVGVRLPPVAAGAPAKQRGARHAPDL